MSKQFPELAGFGPYNMDATRAMSEWSRGWQAIAAEVGDYSKRSMEDGTKTLSQLMQARSVDQVLAIQSSYIKRSYDEYFRQMTKIGGMYMNIAKDAINQGVRG